jgi:hypothetical protein
MPSNFKYTAGLNHVGAYQASARPFIKNKIALPFSGSNDTAVEVTFPKVTKFITIQNNSTGSSPNNEIRVAFARDGIGPNPNYIKLAPSASFSADFRVTKVYLASDLPMHCTATVIAGLTNIDDQQLTDSWNGLSGVSKP